MCDLFLKIWCRSRLNANFSQTHALVWSYFVGDEMPGIFELDWQIVDGFNRIAIAMEARTVAVIDWSKVVLSDGSDPVTSG